MTADSDQLHKALLKVAEDPDRPGTVDRQRLEQYLLRVEGRVVNGLKFMSATTADGKRRWYVEKMG